MRFASTLFVLANALLALAAPHIIDAPAPSAASLNETAELEKRSGQGGYLNLVNGGSYTWRLTYSHGYQMNSWSFPSSVAPYTTARVYVEFDTTFGRNQKDDSGEATYQLDGTDWSFQLQARAPGGRFTLQSYLQGMSTQNNAQGSTINLGWVHDGTVNWVLSGKFTSSRPPPNWMQANLPFIGNLNLRQLSMPGSHDAGMSRITGKTAFGNECNSLTQDVDILGQLNAGSRYFDVRPIISGGGFATGHYTGDAAVLNTFQGANGQWIDEIVSALNTFTANNKELIVINLSHSLNTDVGTSNYRPFNQDEWNGVLNKFMGVSNLLTADRLPGGFDPRNHDLSNLKLNQLIGDRAAVVLVVQDGMDLGGWYGRGVFNYGQYGNIFNSYSDSNDVNNMRNDQLNKLVNRRDPLFLLSWTLTQQGVEAALCTKSILDFARTANPVLYTDLINAVSPTRNIVPNVLYTDATSNGDLVGVAMAYNWWQANH